jgi:hypothetical protein
VPTGKKGISAKDGRKKLASILKGNDGDPNGTFVYDVVEIVYLDRSTSKYAHANSFAHSGSGSGGEVDACSASDPGSGSSSVQSRSGSSQFSETKEKNSNSSEKSSNSSEKSSNSSEKSSNSSEKKQLEAVRVGVEGGGLNTHNKKCPYETWEHSPDARLKMLRTVVAELVGYRSNGSLVTAVVLRFEKTDAHVAAELQGVMMQVGPWLQQMNLRIAIRSI